MCVVSAASSGVSHSRSCPPPAPISTSGPGGEGRNFASVARTTRRVSAYGVAHVDEIDELDDGRCPWRPVRHHFGITAFGVNAWTGRAAGDRIINEHDETEADGDEELYLVQRGRAVFELDGERVQVGAWSAVAVTDPTVRRGATAAAPGTRLLVVGAGARPFASTWNASHFSDIQRPD